MYVIVAGCSVFGAELAIHLAENGDDVVVVDRRREDLDRLGSAFAGVIVEGIPIDVDVLTEAGIKRADALVAVTNSDEVNLMIGQIASSLFGLRRVVVQVSDPQLEESYRRYGITTFRPERSGLGQLRILLGSDGVSLLMSLGAGEVQLVQFEIMDELAGTSADHLSVPGKSRLIGVVRDGTVQLLSAGQQLQANDVVIAAIRLDARTLIQSWSKPPTGVKGD
jgi:trk system potassium uptake protein TrkA